MRVDWEISEVKSSMFMESMWRKLRKVAGLGGGGNKSRDVRMRK
mgnify:CR=1 FL=1